MIKRAKTGNNSHYYRRKNLKTDTQWKKTLQKLNNNIVRKEA